MNFYLMIMLDYGQELKEKIKKNDYLYFQI